MTGDDTGCDTSSAWNSRYVRLVDEQVLGC
jgi:hypothetical protein